MRIGIAAAVLMVTASAWAQPLPGGLTKDQINAIPPEVLKSLPPNVLSTIPLSTLKQIPPDLFRDIPPDLLAKIPPNAATMTPEQAKAYYRNLDPATKQSVKAELKDLKSRIASIPGLMDWLKSVWMSLHGS